MSYQHVQIEVTGHVAELRLNRPEQRNAMSPAMGDEVERAVAELNGRDEVRAVVVRGNGKAFSSGGDFSLLKRCCDRTPDENRRTMRRFYESYLSILALRAPSIAAIHGHALGAGLCFALACDLRLAADTAQLGMTFVKVGLHPGMGGTHLLTRAVGPAWAAELFLTGRVMAAEQALRIGLVNAVHPAAELVRAAQALAAEIASAAPVAVAQTKATLRQERSLAEALDREAYCQAVDYATADMTESVAAFREKRAPAFTGR
jgi:enoyl-CoA hydratase/carnithine racemase